MTDPSDLSYQHLSPEEMEVGLIVARVGVGTVDYVTDTVTLDALSAALFGFEPGVAIDRKLFHSRIHPEDWPLIEAEVDHLLSPERADIMDLTHRIVLPDGELRWVNARKQVTFDPATRNEGPVTGVFAVVDITRQKRAEEQSKILLGEMNHRTKNVLAVVNGIVRQLERVSAPEEFPERLRGRLLALARNQDALAKGASSRFDLAAVLEQQAKPFDLSTSQRLQSTGPQVELSSNAAQALGMVFHELLTNAVKYGALSVPEGQLDVTWELAGDHLHLAWREQGGPPVTAPTREGYGAQVVSSLPRMALEAEVTLEYAADGLRYDLRIPRSALV